MSKGDGLMLTIDGATGYFPQEFIVEAIKKKIPRFVLCPKGWQGVRQTRYYCPACKKLTRDHEKFCHSCGQAVKYPKVVVSKAENKLVLDWSDTK
jgi:predicted amidophosphoribosyltransferase